MTGLFQGAEMQISLCRTDDNVLLKHFYMRLEHCMLVYSSGDVSGFRWTVRMCDVLVM